MDLDRFLAANRPAWDRLAELTRRAGRGPGRLRANELDELVRLYLMTSGHLSTVQTTFSEPALVARLSQQVAAAGAVIYGSRPRSLRRLGRFFTTTYPAAVWRVRWFIVVSAALTLLPALAMGVWLANSDAALDASAPEAVRQAYLEEDFEDYYSSEPAAVFASSVFTNNVQVAFFAFAGGIAFCVVTAGVLAFNGANVGWAAGLFAAAGQQPKFWGLILPHGLLELTAVIVAGAAGLRLGWTLIDPGDRSRADALAEEGKRSVVIVLGLILAFGVAGTIEGFVTGSDLPTSLRVGVGVVAWLAFVAHAIVFGRQAAARGITGALGEGEPSWTAPR